MSGSITFDHPGAGWVASGRFFDEVLSRARDAADDGEVSNMLSIAMRVGFVTLDGEEPQAREFARLLVTTIGDSLRSNRFTVSESNRKSLEELQALSADFLRRHQQF